MEHFFSVVGQGHKWINLLQQEKASLPKSYFPCIADQTFLPKRRGRAPNCSGKVGPSKRSLSPFIQLHRTDDKLVLSSNTCMKTSPFPCINSFKKQVTVGICRSFVMLLCFNGSQYLVRVPPNPFAYNTGRYN